MGPLVGGGDSLPNDIRNRKKTEWAYHENTDDDAMDESEVD
jgi:hypothetical protein